MSDSFNGISHKKAGLVSAAAVIFAAAAMSGCGLYENSGENVFAEPVLPSAAAEYTSAAVTREKTDSPWEGEYSRSFSLPEPARKTYESTGETSETESHGYDSDSRTVAKGDAASKQGDAENVLPEPSESSHTSPVSVPETVTTALSAVPETASLTCASSESHLQTAGEEDFSFTLPAVVASETAPSDSSGQQDYDKDFFSGDLFIGDSISTGYSLYGFLDDKNVYAKIGLNPSTVLTKSVSTCYGEIGISSMLGYTSPGRVYIMLGSNGIQWLSVGSMLQSTDTLVKLINECCPDAQAVIVSVPPVTAAYDASVDDVNVMEKINEYNTSLSAYCNANDMLFVDAASLLKDETGFFNGSYAESDGMHFKYSAYKTLLYKIQSDVEEFEGRTANALETVTSETAASETTVPDATVSDMTVSETTSPETVPSETTVWETTASETEVSDSFVSETETTTAAGEETRVVPKKKPNLKS